ncbi:hypothetical protein [Gynuella sunshinyii]|uniref:Uncharacterized protein n=1 Tax=Gynuella sunshinyii YC6258 TaxID=1445510 RepID=A0A0C5VWE3_9GAMM|nr:hypothetical protein [Gynuella sunshinyii]AJQ97633.1 hypothetical Protein YC6258_05605 [Gynuella sunshinyii YC6258]
MKISDSHVLLNGQQTQSAQISDLTNLTVTITDREQTQANLESSAQTPISLSGSQREATQSAGITLSLSTTTAEQQQISTQSSVTYQDSGATSEHASSYLAEHLSQQLTETEITVSRVFPASRSQQIDSNVYVSVGSVLTVERQENLSLEALGQVTTEDGRSIDFMLALDFNRHVQQQQTNTFVGNVDLIDPLMININGGAVELSDLTFEFDLNADGKLDTVSQTAAGTGFLVFDKNHNGTIDNGNEMFGPATGHGFDELRQYDEDGNGWIDENDSIYSQLGFMSFNDQGQSVESLASTGVGAIYLGSVASDYDLNSDSGEFQGSIKQSGVALSEDGKVLLVQEVHLKNFETQPSTGPYTRMEQTVSTEAGDTLHVDSALSFFQFDDTTLDARNAHTLVRLSYGMPSDLSSGIHAPLTRSAERDGRNHSNYEVNWEVTGQTVANTAASPQRSNHYSHIQQWITNSMRSISTTDNHVSVLDRQPQVTIPEAARFSFLENLPDRFDLGSKDTDSRLQEMRSMIENLKRMRQQQQQSLKNLSEYTNIQNLVR